ncbi:MAG: fibronectin type III domain-containing protein [Ruminococcaceae bacterium]|nr:fibronectin type III domain-containing protein [Oscillospiraceae bacterium]
MKKIKSLMLLIATMLILTIAFCMNASAAEWIPLNESAQYSYDADTGVMIIRGTDGKIKGYDFAVECSNHYHTVCHCSFWEFDDQPFFTDAEYAANEAAKGTKTLIVEEGISELTDGVFTEFENAEVIILPQSVTEIPNGAFYKLRKLRTVVLSNSLVSIGEAAFAECTGLQSMYLPSSLKSIGDAAFFCCNPNLIRIPESVEKKGEELFFPEIGIEVSWKNSGRVLEAYPEYGNLAYYSTAHENAGTEFYTYDKTNGKYTKIGETNEIGDKPSWNPNSNTNYIKLNISEGKSYNFACRFFRVIDGRRVYSDYSETITFATSPKKVKVTASQTTADSIKLSWNKSEGATGYRVYQYKSSKWVTVSATSNLSCTVKNLSAGKKYNFVVRPYFKSADVVAWGDYDTYTFATTPDTVTAKPASPSKGKITLTWNGVSGDIDGYRVYYKLGNGAYKIYKNYATPQNLTFTNLKSGSKYTFAVRAGIKTSGGIVWSGYKEVPVTVK